VRQGKARKTCAREEGSSSNGGDGWRDGGGNRDVFSSRKLIPKEGFETRRIMK